MANHKCDVVVIGSGPGGYVAAIRASQLGLKTICVEKKDLGGVCLNIGCIPTKALLKTAEYKHFLDNASDFGFEIDKVKFDFSKVIDRSRKVANQMSGGVKFLFKKYKVDTVFGHGNIVSKSKVEVSDKDGNVTDTIEAKHIIVATGARPRQMDGIEVDYENVITSTEAMLQKELPKSMIVMGAGAIGIEFAYFFNEFDVDVTIVEYADRILPIEDKDVSKELERNFKKSGIKLLTKSKVLSAKKKGKGVEVVIENKDGSKETLQADKALNAVGIQANIENLGLEEVGIVRDDLGEYF